MWGGGISWNLLMIQLKKAEEEMIISVVEYRVPLRSARSDRED
jgi:hypothetical protein